jgi:hypothetical protein
MVVLLPEHPLRPGEVEPDYAEEHAAAAACGFDVALYRHESVTSGDLARAVRFVPVRNHPTPTLLRGWMLRDAQYAQLAVALSERGHALINSPAAYAQAHYLPQAYPLLVPHTPETRWTNTPDLDEAWQLYQDLRSGDVVAKDHVKSVKHRWFEACFIPAHADEARFRGVLRTLREDRDKLFEKGFVLRRFVPLVSDGLDMRGHPADREVRLFFFNGEIVVRPKPQFLPPPDLLDVYCSIARKLESRFLSMDLAETAAGGWTIIEVGDGGVSGLPVSLLADAFFTRLRELT